MIIGATWKRKHKDRMTWDEFCLCILLGFELVHVYNINKVEFVVIIHNSFYFYFPDVPTALIILGIILLLLTAAGVVWYYKL